MNDNIKRILIIDDNAGRYFVPHVHAIDAGFKHDGVEVETVAVTGAAAAIEQIDLWAKEGKRADIISCDNLFLEPATLEILYNGPEVIRNLIAHIKKTYDEESLPDQFFYTLLV